MDAFYLEDYVGSRDTNRKVLRMSFDKLCETIKDDFIKEWDRDGEDTHATLELQKKAIIGYANEVAFFKEKIRARIKEYNVDTALFPPWYESVIDGIYHENWGLAGVAEWFSEPYKQSSSAKIIGDRIYFMQDGRMKLMPQTIDKHRREQLVRAFLLLTPQERLDKNFHEIYLLDGTRVTIFRGKMTKQEQDVIIFRRYVVPNYTFEEQARRGTIPKDAIDLLKAMVDFGPNIVVVGQVRSSKTTFLSTWQSYEDPTLEGVMVETDPEIPLHRMMPNAPIIQLIADNEELRRISKNLLRSDADYFVLAEARDGNALETALKVAAKGTRRMKLTFHCKDPLDFPYDVAWEIVKATGGDLETTARKVAASFDYVFHFVQLANKSQKRLRGIYELSMGRGTGKIKMVRICAYDYQSDSWRWKNHIGTAKKEAAEEENREAFERFSKQLELLAAKHPFESRKEDRDDAG
jgi:pilus assembly protein CpaF